MSFALCFKRSPLKGSQQRGRGEGEEPANVFYDFCRGVLKGEALEYKGCFQLGSL